MTQLFTVHFTTKHLVSQFDEKGRKTGEYEAEIPQTVSALPHSTAMGYKKFGNFKIEPYYMSVAHRPFEAKKVHTEARGFPSGRNNPARATSVPSGKTAARDAAATGDLAAAINAGAR